MSDPAFVAAAPVLARRPRTLCNARRPRMAASAAQRPAAEALPTDTDVIVIGSGMGGLTTAAQLAASGARVGVLESYAVPGGSSANFTRGEYRFDVGASMIFGLGDNGSTNLLTRALDLVGARVDSLPDPVQVHYHLPDALSLRVHRDYETWMNELATRFPDDARAARAFYDECWSVFHSLNAMPLLSLEEPAYLLRVARSHPAACFNLTRYLAANAGDIATRVGIRDPVLRRFIDMECYSWSVAPAERTPMINAGMVFADRHYGGVRYPVGGVGTLARALAEGIEQRPGCWVRCRTRVTRVLFDGDGRAVGVRLASGETVRARAVVSNATRWDTFSGDKALVPAEHVPEAEARFQQLYEKSPSFVSVHLGVRADVMPSDIDCHHILLDDWDELETARGAKGTLFVSLPSTLDKTVAPEGRHIVHAFVPSWMDEWDGLSVTEYAAQKKDFLERIVTRLEKTLIPGLGDAIELAEIGTPRTHRRFLRRRDGSYGPVPSGRPKGLLGMPFNRTSVEGLYCVGDSTFPGQGLNATAFSGFSCGHRIAADLGLVDTLPKAVDKFLTKLLSETRLYL